jgi:class 3 adenylate cyclase/pimeloyl-ACP methyl ester carboxylesterase
MTPDDSLDSRSARPQTCFVDVPDVAYARSGEVAIAYQVFGEGPVDLVFARGFAGDLLTTWEQPPLVRQLQSFAAIARVLMLDKRGTGLSDGFREPPTLETRMDDLRLVMDAAGSERAVLWSAQDGARLALLFAATYPERTAGLVLYDPHATSRRDDDYPWAPSDEEWRRRLADAREGWGTVEYFRRLVADWAPERVGDREFLDWFVRHMRRSLSPGAAVGFLRATMGADVRDVLAAVRVPTLVLAAPDRREPAAYVASRIRTSELVVLPAVRGLFTWLDVEAHERAMEETERFVARVGRAPSPDPVLATVLFTDIVSSTDRAAELGDRAWRELLERHHAIMRRRLAEFRGDELDTAGDGFLAAFDGPGRAIQCALAFMRDVPALGLEVRAGVHTGECERLDGKLAGIAVAVGARIASMAKPGEILVSGTVQDLVAGSPFVFEDRGAHELKGVPGSWRLAALLVPR